MIAWRARLLAERGQYAAADRCLAEVMRHPHVAPITRVSALPVAGVLAPRRGDGDGGAALDEGIALAVRTGEAQRLGPVAAARAEAAATVHREAHGLVADEIYPVAEGA